MNKKLLYLFLVIVAVIGLVFLFNISSRDLAAGYEGPTFKTITDDEAVFELENDNSIILIDVRYSYEHYEQRIPGSISIPLDELEEKILTEIPNKETRIFIYCQKGKRSIEAAELLIELGYTNIYNLGGIEDWKYNVIEGF